MSIFLRSLCLAVVLVPALSTQHCVAQATHAKASAASQDIDPLALDVLRAATDPIRQANTFSFRVLVSREYIGSNSQMITLFHESSVLVQRPDKMQVTFHGRGKEVHLYYNAGNAILYTPEEKLYTTMAAPSTLDTVLRDLEKHNIYLPSRNFLEADPYASLTRDLLTAYVVGKVEILGETVHHLAFTEPGAEWQVWVIGGDRPRIRRLEVIDKSIPEHPRTVVDFFDWNLNATADASSFTFSLPDDAYRIDMLSDTSK